MNNNTAEGMSALAIAVDSINMMDPISHLNSTSTPTIAASIIPWFGSGFVKSLEAPASLITPAALTIGAITSQSPSPVVKSDAEASSAEDEPRPTRSKARNGKSAIKSKGGNVEGKVGDRNTGVIANGTGASATATNATTKKGPHRLISKSIPK